MKKFHKITNSEMEIMEVIWGLDAPVTISQLLTIFRERKWKIQTMATFLTRLADKGLLIIDRQTKANRYSPAVTKQEYGRLEARSVLDSMYNGSLKGFLFALYSEGEIDAKEAEELRDWFSKAGEDNG